MKVSIGMNLQTGPWGGGNQFGHALVKHLREKGVFVSFDLLDPDLDIIMLTEPRSDLSISAYNDLDILRYLREINPHALVVHRINTCDEPRGTTGVNARLMAASRCADHTVFVSTWLQNLFLAQGIASRSYSVIVNGSDRAIFHPQGYQRLDGRAPLRVVTHHWGANWLKGFDIYQRLDDMLADPAFSARFTFTYIGRLPENFVFHRAAYVPPKHGPELADALRAHHVYLTAAQNEPGGNHQNEGALCGLPLLYRESGCMPEYCAGYGIAFTTGTFEQKLDEMAATYDQWVGKMPDYPRTSDRTAAGYYDLFTSLLAHRASVLGKRPKTSTRRGWLVHAGGKLTRRLGLR